MGSSGEEGQVQRFHAVALAGVVIALFGRLDEALDYRRRYIEDHPANNVVILPITLRLRREWTAEQEGGGDGA